MSAADATYPASDGSVDPNSHDTQLSAGHSATVKAKNVSLASKPKSEAHDVHVISRDITAGYQNDIDHGEGGEDVAMLDLKGQAIPPCPRAASSQTLDWAHGRSPLQKLEATLGEISKEEKRARAQEAELKLQKRIARKSAVAEAHHDTQLIPRSFTATGKIGIDTNAEHNPSSQRAAGGQSDALPEREALVTERQEQHGFQPEDYKNSLGDKRNLRSPVLAQNRTLSLNSPVVRPMGQSLHTDGQQPTGTARKGSTSTRPVLVSNRPSARGIDLYSGARSPEDAPISELQAIKLSALKRTAEGTSSEDRKRTQHTKANDHQAGPVLGFHDSRSSENYATTDKNTVSSTPYPTHAQNEISSQSKPKRQIVSFNVPQSSPLPLSEWKNAPVARLYASDFDFQNIDIEKGMAWWEGGNRADRRKSRALPKSYHALTRNPEASRTFDPPIFLKCGPLLRYTGIGKRRVDGPSGPTDKKTWRGSIMIVTQDSRSVYEPSPTLRLFSQPMDLLPPPPAKVGGEEGIKLAPEYIDPTAGLPKLGRDGRPLFIKPVDHTEEEVDLSFVESDDGIYELTPSLIDYVGEGAKLSMPSDRLHSIDGETVGAYREILGTRLYIDPGRDVTFWRFNLEIDMIQSQQRIAYRLNQGPALGFWIPAFDQPMSIMFYTCNGFSSPVDSNKYCGPDPLWRDIINEHQTQPFHVMIGGGDQIFNDGVAEESGYFQDWLKIKGIHAKHNATFGREFKEELEGFYLKNYIAWFSQGLFSFANSQIPMVNMWNDHEIIEGFGSYADEFMGTPVMSNLGRIAFKYYLLFQHHSVPEETDEDEPSWLLGAHLGPYINYKSRNIFLSLGNGISFLGLDCRTERMSNEILSEPTCDLIWDRCHREIIKGETKHLIVLSSVPVAYPRMAMLKNILNSRNSLGRAGIFGSLVNRHGGDVEIYDDHWTAKQHKEERIYLIEDLQDLAAEKSVRVTILSGDVHLAAIGQLISNPSLDIAKDKDYRYMPNIISSAIVDAPETDMVSDMLNRRSRIHHMDSNTDEEIIPIFTHDVDNQPRNNKRLLPRRNWCSIREYLPGTTPPESPELRPSPGELRPGRLQRTLSLTRADHQSGNTRGGLFRRLSQRGRPPARELRIGQSGRRMSMDEPFPPAETGDSYFPPHELQPGPILRRPTNFSGKVTKGAIKQGDNGVGEHVNLEGGLAITLNLEINPREPSGITVPYKLLIPALHFDDSEYDPPPIRNAKGWKKWLGVSRTKIIRKDESEDGEYAENGYGGHAQEDMSEEVNKQPKQQQPRLRKWLGKR